MKGYKQRLHSQRDSFPEDDGGNTLENCHQTRQTQNLINDAQWHVITIGRDMTRNQYKLQVGYSDCSLIFDDSTR